MWGTHELKGYRKADERHPYEVELTSFKGQLVVDARVRLRLVYASRGCLGNSQVAMDPLNPISDILVLFLHEIGLKVHEVEAHKRSMLIGPRGSIEINVGGEGLNAPSIEQLRPVPIFQGHMRGQERKTEVWGSRKR